MKLFYFVIIFCNAYKVVKSSHVHPHPIIGGQYISIANAPWQLSLQTRTHQQRCRFLGGRIICEWQYGSWKHICGASLIEPRWAVTARHCLVDVGASDELWQVFRVVAGITFLTEPGTNAYLEHVFYNNTQQEADDFALLYLSSPIYNNLPKVKSIELAMPLEDFTHRWCYTSGWGRTGDETLSNILKGTWVYIRDNNHLQCLAFKKIHPWEMCVQDYLQGFTACKGDSGGPLVCYKNGQPILVGVTYKGVAGCPLNTPVIYTSVSYFFDKIFSTITVVDGKGV